jgi:Domain of unknown function (DUF4190)
MSQVNPGYAPAGPKSSGLAIASMVLGIISIVLFCVYYLAFPCAVLALVFGVIARSKISRGEGSGGGMAMAGIICGLISIVLASTLLIVGLSLLHYGAPALQKAAQQMQQYIQQQQQQHLPATNP